MSKEFSVTGITVAPQEKRAFVYRRCGNRIDASRSAQFDSGLNVTRSCFSRGARFNSWFDKTTYVIEMKDDRLNEICGEGFTVTDNVVTGLQIQGARGVSQLLRVADDHCHAAVSDLFLRYGL